MVYLCFTPFGKTRLQSNPATVMKSIAYKPTLLRPTVAGIVGAGLLGSALLAQVGMAQIEEAPDTHCNQDEQSYTGNITGYTGTPDDIEVTLSRPGELRTIKPAPNGCFTFHDLQPGQYAIKVNAKGHRTTAARIIDIPQATGFDNKPYALEVLPADPNIFTYHWEEDPATVSGAEYSSQAVTPRYVQFQNTTVE